MESAKQRSHIERWGLFSAARFAVAWRLREWLGLHLYGIYTRPLGAAPAESPDDARGLSHRLFEPADVDALLTVCADPRLRLDEAFVRSALAKGDACNAALLEGQLIAYSWMAFTPTHDADGVYARFGPGYRYLYNAFTLPEFRGRHALRHFRAYGDGHARQRGCTSSIAFIAIDNDASMRSALGSGNRRIGFAGYLKIGSLFIPFRTVPVRAIGFEFFMPGKGDAAAQPKPDSRQPA
jgi:hypothetical protein